MLTPLEQRQLVNLLQKATDTIAALPTETPCIACRQYRDGWCEKWQDDIPENMLKLGCEEWFFQETVLPY